MTYLSDKSRINRKRGLYFIFLCFFSLLIYFWPTLQVKLYPIIEPVIILVSNGKNNITNTPSVIHTYFSSRDEMSKQNASLMLEIEKLENEISEKEAFIKENNYIKESGARLPSSTIILYPIMKDITTMYQTVLLSKGFKNGVEENTIVYLRGRQPVCVISLVYESTSLCNLFSAPDVKTEGVIASSSVMLPLIGVGGGAFVADVARNINIAIGDTVYLASDQTMMLGKITDIVRNDQDTSLHVFVRGLYNPLTSSVFYINK
jgi:cell shape-determining protein MreC